MVSDVFDESAGLDCNLIRRVAPVIFKPAIFGRSIYLLEGALALSVPPRVDSHNHRLRKGNSIDRILLTTPAL
jgi:hypothetical protein